MRAPAQAGGLLSGQIRDLIPATLAGLVEEFALGATDIARLWAAEDFDTAYEEWDEPEPFRECFTMAADFAAHCTAAGVEAWRVLIESMHPYTDLHAVTAVRLPVGEGSGHDVFHVDFTAKQFGNLPAICYPDGPRRTDPNDMGPGSDSIACPLIWRGTHRFGHPQFADPEFTCTTG